MEPRSRGGGVSVNPSRHHRHWLRGRTPSFAIGVACRSGKRRRAHELVSRHPNMLGICVGRNGLMIGIPKELLEKNPGSSSSALLQGFVDPGSASWGWRADGLRSGWLGQHVWSMCTRTHFARARTTCGGLLGDIASHSWMQHCTGHWLGCATWGLMSNPVVVHRHPRAFSHRVKPIRCPFRPNWGTSGQGTFNFGCYYNLILPPRDENWVASAHTGNGRAASSGICLPLPSSVPCTGCYALLYLYQYLPHKRYNTIPTN